MTTQLVTGGEGFIGTELSRTLLAAGQEVVSTVLGDGTPHERPPQVRAESRDVTDAAAAGDVVAVASPATVYHLVAQSNPVLSWAKQTATIQTSVLGTVHLLDAVRAAGLSSRVLIVAPSAEYGHSPRPGHLLDEDLPSLPVQTGRVPVPDPTREPQTPETSPLHIQVVHLVAVRTKSGPTFAGGGGGGLIHIVRLTQEWARQGHSVTVSTNLPEAFEGTDIRVVGIGHANPETNGTQAGSLLQPLKLLILSILDRSGLSRLMPYSTPAPQASIVIAASPNLYDILGARRLAKGTNLPVVVTFHHLTPPPWWHPDRRGGVVRCTGAWLLTQAALVITKVCGFVPGIDQGRILSESGWRFSGPVLRDDAFLDSYPVSDTIEPPNRPIDVCFVSRLSPMKGLFDLVSIWAEVHRRLPAACLVVGGDFESQAVERRFRLVVEKMGLTGFITLRGHLSDRDKHALLAASKIFVYPSYEEGWSLAVMEAAAYGCVPVIYDLPAYDYLGSATPRGPPGDVHALGELVVDLLSNPQKRDDLAMNLATIPRTFAAEGVARDQIAFFRALLSRAANQ